MSSPQGGPLNQTGTERARGENHAVGNPRRVAENRSRALACMLHVMHVTCCMPLTWGMGGGRVGWGTGTGKVAGPKGAMGHVHDPREWPEKWRWKGRERQTWGCCSNTPHMQWEGGGSARRGAEVVQSATGRHLERLKRVPSSQGPRMRVSSPRDILAQGALRESTSACTTFTIGPHGRDCMQDASHGREMHGWMSPHAGAHGAREHVTHTAWSPCCCLPWMQVTRSSSRTTPRPRSERHPSGRHPSGRHRQHKSRESRMKRPRWQPYSPRGRTAGSQLSYLSALWHWARWEGHSGQCNTAGSRGRRVGRRVAWRVVS